MADIVLINPRFEVSFWGLEYAMPLLQKNAAQPVGSLPLLAALRPTGAVLIDSPAADAARAVCHLARMPIPPGHPSTRISRLRVAGLERYRDAWRELLPLDPVSA